MEYTDYASIQGLNYIFVENQTIFGRVFWSIVVFLMALLGSYWCVQSYLDWQAQPVLVTITTTALPVTQVEFPAVTFCSNGMNKNITLAAFYQMFFSYLKKSHNITVHITPTKAANLVNSKESTVNPELTTTCL
jgi:hypothetical protein